MTVMNAQDRHVFKEVEMERLLLREPNDGRVRAVLETAPARDQEGPAVPVIRLSLLSPDGEPALVAEVDEQGAPTVHVGHPDRGTTAVITPRAIDLWSGGNIVASVRSTDDGGSVEIRDRDGNVVVELPE